VWRAAYRFAARLPTVRREYEIGTAAIALAAPSA
jgi:hypothetical protein